MLQSNSPPKFPIPWGSSAGGAYIRSIPESSQIGIQNGAASLTDGFPPLTFVPSEAGGTPPFGQDFNGILNQLSLLAQWQSAGGPIFYDSGFSAAIGGYPKGTVVQSTIVPGFQWLSTADNNTNNPDTGGANWVQNPGQILTGTPQQSLTTTIPYGYVSANGTTIGNASSNATQRADADTQFLFFFIWMVFPTNTLFNSSGGVVARGADAATDYAANRAIATPNMNGSGLIGADSQDGSSSSLLNGVPIVSGSTTAPGSIIGENFHDLVAAEIPTLTVTAGANAVAAANSGISAFTAGSTGSPSASVPQSAGSWGNASLATIGTLGNGHNTVERSFVVYWNLKL
jgi:hypothetical protein